MGKHNITIEDSSPLITYTDISLWGDSPVGEDSTEYSGYTPEFNSYHQTISNTTIEFPFNGSSIFVFGTTSSSGGPYTVSLTTNTLASTTRAEQTNQNTISNTTLYQQLLYSRTNLDTSVPHHLSLRNLGPGQFILDFLVVESDDGSTSQARDFTIDDTSVAFSYSGDWTTETAQHPGLATPVLDLLYKETSHHTTQSNASARLLFRGSGVAVHGQYGLGAFEAKLDGGNSVRIQNEYDNTTMPTPEDRPQELLYMADGLNEEDHVLVLTNLGGSDGVGFNIDYAVVSTSDPNNVNGLQNTFSSAPAMLTAVRTNDTGVIVGAVLGGLALLLAIGLAVYLFLCRPSDLRRRNVVLVDLEDGDTYTDKITPWNMPPQPTPFVVASLPATTNPAPSTFPTQAVVPTVAQADDTSNRPEQPTSKRALAFARSASPAILVPERPYSIPDPGPSQSNPPQVRTLQLSNPTLPPTSPPTSRLSSPPVPPTPPRPPNPQLPPTTRLKSADGRRPSLPGLPSNPRISRLPPDAGISAPAARAPLPPTPAAPPQPMGPAAEPRPPLPPIPVTPTLRTPKHATDAGVTLESSEVAESSAQGAKRRTLPPVYDPHWSVMRESMRLPLTEPAPAT
ncbi:hypothetical protein BV25DRAFT_1915861 [Artomyces pyxidatus]|uniref:Uncharacterized protein n=1 Tax=Artomyces pyxidatus TaxID=48021 RepID=A0ACB8T205_9AGAM|nr:hypothetical protein BV25DRAFT_1915861 [Artomyces pyxidatus]